MDNTTGTLAYTIKVEGLEDILTQIGQLEKALGGIGDKFNVVAKQSSSMEVTIEETTKSVKAQQTTLDAQGASIKTLDANYSKLKVSVKASSEASVEATKSMKDNGQATDVVANSYLDLKQQQESVANSMKNVDLTTQQGKKSFEENATTLAGLNKKIGELDTQLNSTKTPVEQLKANFTKSLDEVKKSFSDVAEGVEALKKAGGELGLDDYKAFNDVIEGSQAAIKGAKEGMDAYNAVVKIGSSIVSGAKAIQNAYTTAMELYKAGTLASTVASEAFNLVLDANPIGAVIGAVVGLVAAGKELFEFFSGNTHAAEDLNKALDEQNAAFDKHKEQVEGDIALMKAQGATEEEIAAKKRQLKVDEVNNLADEEAKAQKALEEASNSQKAEIQKRIDDIKAKEEKANQDLKIIDAQAATDKEKQKKSADDKLRELQIANIQDEKQRQVEALKFKQEQEKAALEASFKNQANYNQLVEQLNTRQKQEMDELTQKFVDHRTAVQKLNDDITKLSDKAINELITKGDVSVGTLNNIAEKMEKVRVTNEMLKEGLANTPAAIEGRTNALKKQLDDLTTKYTDDAKYINATIQEGDDKDKKQKELYVNFLEERYKKLGELAATDRTHFTEITSEAADVFKELAQAKKELEELGKDKPQPQTKKNNNDNNDNNSTSSKTETDITKKSYEEQKALAEKHFEFLKGVIEETVSNEKDATQQITSAHEQQYQTELDLIEKRRVAILNAHKEGTDFTKEEIDELKNLGDSADEAKKKLQAIEDHKPAENPGLAALGFDKKGEKEFNDAMSNIESIASSGAQAIGSIFELQKQKHLNAIQEEEDKQIAAVNKSTLSEKAKAAKIEKIKKDSADKAHQIEVEAKKKQQKLDIITSIINTAIAVGKALGSAPFPANVVLAALAGVEGAVQTAIIANQKFAQGGIIPFEEGGTIQGPSHAQGGVPFISGGKMMEAEGGELIVNRNIWSRPDFVRSISMMNAHTGGRKFFADGGVVPTPSVPGVYIGSPNGNQKAFDTEGLVNGLRGVIASEVGSLQVVNNVVDTSDQQTRLQNLQTSGSF